MEMKRSPKKEYKGFTAEERAKMIGAMIADHRSYAYIAAEFGISRSRVGQIVQETKKAVHKRGI